MRTREEAIPQSASLTAPFAQGSLLENEAKEERRYRMTIIEFLRRTYKTCTPWNIPVIRPRVKCADGFMMSVQASASHYCIPRKDGEGYYSAVEVGYPSETTPEFFKYSAGGGVYGYVPIKEVQKVCDKHGGIVGADFSKDDAGYWTEEERRIMKNDD